jgi:hypothetical protein
MDEFTLRVTELKANQKRLYLIFLASGILFVIFALALGLGFGLSLGLKQNGGKSTPTRPSASPASAPAVSNAPLGNQVWRKNTSEYTLNMTGWDLNAPPTTRSWNFILSEIEAYPDGK